MVTTYKCKNCNNIFKNDVNGKVPLTVECPKCKQKAIRTFGQISFDKEDDTVSDVMQLMLYSTNPTGKTNSVI